jgi:hypothetical protein
MMNYPTLVSRLIESRNFLASFGVSFKARDQREPGKDKKEKYERSFSNLMMQKFNKEKRELLALYKEKYPNRKSVIAEWSLKEWSLNDTANLFNSMLMDSYQMFFQANPELNVFGNEGDYNVHAKFWAMSNAGELIKKIDKTTQQMVQDKITDFIVHEDVTLGALSKKLEPVFGKVRADMIATTEVTRAFAGGHKLIAKQLQDSFKLSGYNPDTIALHWYTNNDDLVCGICGPVNAESITAGKDMVFSNGFDSPPAHPNCRCWTGIDYHMEKIEEVTLLQKPDPLLEPTKPTGVSKPKLSADLPRQKKPKPQMNYPITSKRDSGSGWWPSGVPRPRDIIMNERGNIDGMEASHFRNLLMSKANMRNQNIRAWFDSQVASNLKNSVAKNISEAIQAKYADINRIIRTWADTSNDHNPLSLAVQKTIGKVFKGAKLSTWQKGLVERVTPAEIQKMLNKFDFAMEDVLYTMYMDTQEFLDKAIDEETVTLFRGVKLKDITEKERIKLIQAFLNGEEIVLESNALESFSFDVYTASSFADGDLIIAVNVPKNMILSTPQSGFGCSDEYECVVINTPGTKACILDIALKNIDYYLRQGLIK